MPITSMPSILHNSHEQSGMLVPKGLQAKPQRLSKHDKKRGERRCATIDDAALEKESRRERGDEAAALDAAALGGNRNEGTSHQAQEEQSSTQ